MIDLSLRGISEAIIDILGKVCSNNNIKITAKLTFFIESMSSIKEQHKKALELTLFKIIIFCILARANLGSLKKNFC